MSVAENIKYLRKQKNMTQKQLSEKTGLAVITIQQYEAGKYSPKHYNLIKLATALECGVFDIDESLYINRRIPYFAYALEELRIDRSLTQKELAKELHVKEQNIVDLENGEREPYFHVAERIADYFGTSLLYLYHGNRKYKKGIDNNDKEAMAQENAIKSAPRFTDYTNGKEMLDYPLPYKIPKFTDVSTSFEDAIAEAEAVELKRLQAAYKRLNRKGKTKAVERIEELTEIPRYTKPDTPPQE